MTRASVYISLISAALHLGLLSGAPARAEERSPEPVSVEIFQRAAIQFLPDSLAAPPAQSGNARDHGRVIEAEAELPDLVGPVRATAHLLIEPVPKDAESVWDRWDRAGNVRLSLPGLPDLEVVKFITAYGGRTEYEIDVSQLVPLLRGRKTFRGFIDTWVAPAWHLSFRVSFRADSLAQNPSWVRPLFFQESYTAQDPGEAGATAEVEIPPGLSRVVLYYLVSGHCTDGRDADEFVPKDNVLLVDGRVVYRYRPWRDDCRRFREVNPYCRRWSDGSWSSDYSRSGWCPGDLVQPLELDLTDHLAPGRHLLRFVVENVRPADGQGQQGYWRLSGYLAGWNQLR